MKASEIKDAQMDRLNKLAVEQKRIDITMIKANAKIKIKRLEKEIRYIREVESWKK